jgi:hypothetical protein
MALTLARRGRPLRVPSTFGWWAAFLLISAAGIFGVGRTAPNTLRESFGSGLLPWLTDLATFLAATVVLVWVCSHDESELPKRRIVGYLGILGAWTVAGGFLGLLAPGLAFRSPTEIVLRATVGDGPWMSLLTPPQAAQVQDVLGDVTSARPAAPFAYTNTWGQMVSVLLVLGFVAWWSYARGWRRVAGLSVIALAVVPAVLSLNRGLWVGVVVLLLWVLFQLVRVGKVGTALMALAVVLGVGVAILASPAGDVVQERSAHGHSDSIRAALAQAAIDGGNASPVIGWGGVRQVQGSPQSIAIGSSDDCAQCGSRRVGSTGLLWYLIFVHGYLGAGAFIGFLVASLWRFRRDTTPLGIAAGGVVVLALVYMFTYTNANIGVAVTLAAVGLLYRNEADRVDG